MGRVLDLIFSYSLARRLNKKICEVTMVSPRNHFLFTPLLSTTTVGTLEFRNIIESARRIKNIKYIQASCKSVDADSRTIECANKNVPDTKISVKFDDLVIACGAEANTFNIDGAKENSYFLKQLSDARRIRNRLSEIFEMACYFRHKRHSEP
ncbi:hypothetical protein MHBO_003991 [Bonamia ostreae]|uniref:NADH:ubiquinone reductase (non-electrogenic) n=1 Tax=Bonamia ostreae TaxID=126728 RepID=A0ABV2AS28_9EUKA